ncbi:MAG: hypothetical protein AB7U85_03055 [Alphaproteobacteria bacterium]
MKKILGLLLFILLIGIWSFLYLQGYKVIAINLWDFNPLNSSDWAELSQKWQSGWIIKETNDILFAVSLFLIIPLWLLGVVFCYMINKRIKKSSLFVKKEKTDVYIAPIKTNGPKRPPALISKKNKASAEPLPAAVSNLRKPSVSSAPQQPMDSAVMIEEESSLLPSSHVEPLVPEMNIDEEFNLEEEAIPEPDWDDLAAILHDYAVSCGYIAFSSMPIGNHIVDLVLISPQSIYLICLTPKGKEWIADEDSFNNEPPIWFSEENFSPSPSFGVLQAKESLTPILANLIPEDYPINIEAVVALGYGSILNSENMIEIWQKLGVNVGSFATGFSGGINNIDNIITDISSSPKIAEGILDLISLAIVSAAPDE